MGVDFQLVDEALKLGKIHQIEPAHVALNYSHTKKQRPVAMAAIKQIVGNAQADQELMRQKLFSNFEPDVMNADALAVPAWLMVRNKGQG